MGLDPTLKAKMATLCVCYMGPFFFIAQSPSPLGLLIPSEISSLPMKELSNSTRFCQLAQQGEIGQLIPRQHVSIQDASTGLNCSLK